MTRQPITAVVFDLGGVLIDWNPEYVYRDLIPDATERRDFLANICSPAWNHTMDEGRPMEEALADLAAQHPENAALILAWQERWPGMLGGEVPGTRALAESVAASGMPLFALTNWSADTWPIGRGRHPFVDDLFRGIVVSGHEGVAKPDRGIFRILVERYSLEPATTAFIDDSARNVAAAESLGFITHHFTGASALEVWLREVG